MPNKSSRARPIGNEGEKEGEGGNRSQLGDPVSLKAEGSETEPTEQDRGAKGTAGAKGKGNGGEERLDEWETQARKGGRTSKI